VAFWLAKGAQWTVSEVAERTGLTRQGAEYLLKTMSRVIPIYVDDGRWQEAEGE
jgi:DNA-binding IclR family transcriptional regulator